MGVVLGVVIAVVLVIAWAYLVDSSWKHTDREIREKNDRLEALRRARQHREWENDDKA